MTTRDWTWHGAPPRRAPAGGGVGFFEELADAEAAGIATPSELD